MTRKRIGVAVGLLGLLLFSLSRVTAQPMHAKIDSAAAVPSAGLMSVKLGNNLVAKGGTGRLYLAVTVNEKTANSSDLTMQGRDMMRPAKPLTKDMSVYVKQKIEVLKRFREQIERREDTMRLRKAMHHDSVCACDPGCFCQGGTDHPCMAGCETAAERMVDGLEMPGIAAMKMPETGAPWNICLAMDASKSMVVDRKLYYAQKTAKELIRRMRKDDTISIIAFSEEVVTISRPRQGNARNKKLLINLVGRIATGERTNMYEALQVAASLVRENFDPDAFNRILLISDGKPTKGNTEPYYINSLAIRLASEGIDISTWGLGEDFDEDLLQKLASHRSGNYHPIILNAANISNSLVSEFTKPVLARNTKLLILLEAGAMVENVGLLLSKISPTRIEGNLKDIGTEESRIVVASLRVPTDKEGQITIGSVTLTYLDDANRVQQEDFPITITCTTDTRSVDKSKNNNVLLAALFQDTRDVLTACIEELDKHNYGKAVSLLDANIARLQDSLSILELLQKLPG